MMVTIFDDYECVIRITSSYLHVNTIKETVIKIV